MFPALLSLAILVVPAQADAVPAHSCQDSCRLERDSEGRWGVFCHCRKEKPGSAPHSPDRLLSIPLNRAMALRGSSPADTAAVANNACKGEVEAFRKAPHAARDLFFQATRGAGSVCDCVTARVHFPVTKSCGRTGANELSCSFGISKTGSDFVRPLRNPTLEDYQTCLANAGNRAGASSLHTADGCEAASCAMPPRCGPGLEPFNSADIGECCPRYSCEKRGAAGAQPPAPRRKHEASAQ